MLHNWWLMRAWVEVNTDFVPMRDAADEPIYQFVKSANGTSSTYKAEFGQITTKTWKYAQLKAVTIGETPESIDALIDNNPESGTYGNLVAGSPSGNITIPTLSGSNANWKQSASVETTLADEILNVWEHTVTFRSGLIEYKEGTYSELDEPDFYAPIEEE